MGYGNGTEDAGKRQGHESNDYDVSDEEFKE